mmetsp:Transcript_15146/g.26894  ORF Transcript_15146/g.26894 Transcript_15146/m.26894 type:complete len:99 (+) Transcript_15146:1878-2174(+)
MRVVPDFPDPDPPTRIGTQSLLGGNTEGIRKMDPTRKRRVGGIRKVQGRVDDEGDGRSGRGIEKEEEKNTKEKGKSLLLKKMIAMCFFKKKKMSGEMR